MSHLLSAVCRGSRDLGSSHPTRYWNCGQNEENQKVQCAHRVKDRSADGALQLFKPAPSIPAPLLTFEGMSNQDNFNVFGFRVNPPDPNGEVGPNNFVEMINLVFAVYDKAGNLLVGPVDTGSLWAGFPITDCTDPSGDPVVLYDQFMDRWLLSQFTTAGPEFFNCVAISTTSDPTGSYFRYAFSRLGVKSSRTIPSTATGQTPT